jgi:hypothetical protein
VDEPAEQTPQPQAAREAIERKNTAWATAMTAAAPRGTDPDDVAAGPALTEEIAGGLEDVLLHE